MNKEIDLLGTRSTDAKAWASEFIRLKEKHNWTLEDIDEGLMIGWFANAIETAKDSMSDYHIGVDPGHEDGDQTTYLNNWTTNAEFIEVCGNCEDFGPNGCKIGKLEAKYCTAITSACKEFKKCYQK